MPHPAQHPVLAAAFGIAQSLPTAILVLGSLAVLQNTKINRCVRSPLWQGGRHHTTLCALWLHSAQDAEDGAACHSETSLASSPTCSRLLCCKGFDQIAAQGKVVKHVPKMP